MIKENKLKLYIMAGISASGKSTIAKELAEKENAVIVSSDSIRGEICECGVSDQSKNEEVFKIFHQRIRENLLNKKSVVADATNITIKSRKAIIECARGIDCDIIAIVVAKPYEECIQDNVDHINRENPVPNGVIKKQMMNFQIPFYEEGFNKIKIIQFDNNKISIIEVLNQMKGFDQKNPHHNLDLYQHCEIVGDLFKEKLIYSQIVTLAAYVHDFGKLYTQTFDENEVAHYYRHENVGAYQLLTTLNYNSFWNNNDVLNFIFLINYHMHPINWDSDKAKDKWRKTFGDFKFQLLMDFNECDKYREE